MITPKAIYKAQQMERLRDYIQRHYHQIVFAVFYTAVVVVFLLNARGLSDPNRHKTGSIWSNVHHHILRENGSRRDIRQFSGQFQ